ncbi:MAG: flagellar hook-associated protein FlgK, partial [Burkholderiaceae bacterium]|nr:flagellar hook-associated protein FlgK [Burkholderiaceae bacterium]
MSALLSIGQSALLAAYAQLRTTGHNIANANTPGYTRQETVLASAGGQHTGAGFFGQGVDIVTVQRRYDGFLAAELSSSTALAAADSARAEQLGRLDNLLADTDNGIGVAIDELNAALADLVNRPGDASARQIVLARADALALRMRTVDAQLQQLGQDSSERIGYAATSASDLLGRIASLNGRIAASAGAGQQPNDLLDERDRLLLDLNGYLKATAYTQADGTVSVFAAGGEALVVGNRAATLRAEPDPLDASRQRVVIALGATELAVSADTLGGGSIAGLLRFRDQDLQSARARLGQLAGALAEAFNRQQSLGVDASGAAGQPMFALGEPRATAASTNAGSARLVASVVDGTQLAASDYEIRYDGAQYLITRSADGLQRSYATLPQTIDGLQIGLDSGSGTPAPGDRFQLRSATSIAAGFTRTLSSGAGLATGHAVSAAGAGSNTGDVAVAAFSVDAADPNLSQPVALTFTAGGPCDGARRPPPRPPGAGRGARGAVGRPSTRRCAPRSGRTGEG